MRRARRVSVQSFVSRHVARILAAEAERQGIAQSALVRKYLEEIAMHLAHRYTDVENPNQLAISDLCDATV